MILAFLCIALFDDVLPVILFIPLDQSFIFFNSSKTDNRISLCVEFCEKRFQYTYAMDVFVCIHTFTGFDQKCTCCNSQ